MAAHPRPGEDAWFRALVDSAKDFAILSLDSEGNIVTWNEGARRLFGFREDEVLGKPSSLIFTPEDQAISASERELDNAAREGRAHDDRWHVRRDGSHLWASGLLLAMRDDDGIVRGFVKIVQDKTDARRLEETLRASEEQFARVFLGIAMFTSVVLTFTSGPYRKRSHSAFV